MSESLPENDGQLCAEMENLSVLDVLQRVEPIRKYMECDFYAEQECDHPDYKFQIENISDLIGTESELIGRTFLLPGFDILTRITCAVKFDNFKFSVTFLNPQLEGKSVKWRVNPKFTIRIAQNANEMFTSTNFPDIFRYGETIVYGKSYELCALFLRERVENDAGNPITLHLFVEKLFLTAPEDICLNDDVFLWKVDVSKFNLHEKTYERKVVGLSPFFSSDPEGLKVQMLLYIEDDEFRSEIRFLNEFEFKHKMCEVKVNVMHLTNEYQHTLPSCATFRGNNVKFSSHITLCSRSDMRKYTFNNKLFIKGTWTYE